MKKVFNKIRILMIVPTFNLCGGIESFVMSYFRQLKDKIKIDIITHEINNTEYKKEIEEEGNKVYCMPKYSFSNISKVHKKIKNFFKENHNYDIVHCNMVNAAYIYLKEAKKYGIPCRILHSHQNKYSDNWIHAIRNVPLVFIGKQFVTDRIACSEEAGKFLFKNKKFVIIRNAIDTKKFKYDEKIREKMRKKLNVEDYFVIGNVGRLSNQKNQIFLIRVFKKILEKNNKTKLIFIGEGELKNTLEEECKILDLEDKVIFIKPNNIIYKYMQAFDIFALPSLYEGVGIVNIEAQATGLHTIVSENVPKEACIKKEIIDFLPLIEEKWVEIILKYKGAKRKKITKDVEVAGYDIYKSADELYKFYNNIMKER